MRYCVTINNRSYEVEVERGSASLLSVTEIAVEAAEDKGTAPKQAAPAASTPKVIELSERAAEVNESAGRRSVKAPMAGVIVDIKVSPGSIVRAGDTLLLLEAMKMENEITAPVDGLVVEIKAAKGAAVSVDDVLLVLR